MKTDFESNWKLKTLEQLDKNIRSERASGTESHLVKSSNALCKKVLQKFSVEDLRIMIGQEIGLRYLMPLALEKLSEDLFV
jgi:hypothetical protein